MRWTLVSGPPWAKFEETAEPKFLEFGEAFEIVEAFHPADHGGESDEDDLAKIVAFGLAGARIR